MSRKLLTSDLSLEIREAMYTYKYMLKRCRFHEFVETVISAVIKNIRNDFKH